MKFSIDQAILSKFPELKLGVVVVEGLDNMGSSEEVLSLLRTEQDRIRSEYTTGTLSDHDAFAVWRKAYSAFGAKPKKYKCSVENLYRMILGSEDYPIGHINTLVDIYNYISLKYIFPVGGDDLSHIAGDISLTYAKGDERFVQLNTDEVVHPNEGEIIYRDDADVLCRRWNYRECDKSKMTAETKRAMLVVEQLYEADLSAAVEELVELVTTHCGGTTRTFFLDKNTREVDLDE